MHVDREICRLGDGESLEFAWFSPGAPRGIRRYFLSDVCLAALSAIRLPTGA